MLSSQETIEMGNKDTTHTQKTQNSCNRRRGRWSRPGYQRRLALTVSLMVFLMSSTISSVLYGVLYYQARQRLINPQGYIAEVGLVILVFALVFAGITAAAAGFWCLVMSHRVCGPLVRLKRYMEEVAAGRIPDVRPVRKNDELQDVFDAFSAMLESLERRYVSDAGAGFARAGTPCAGQHQPQEAEAMLVTSSQS
jgi:HAMP domain-containing protein